MCQGVHRVFSPSFLLGSAACCAPPFVSAPYTLIVLKNCVISFSLLRAARAKRAVCICGVTAAATAGDSVAEATVRARERVGGWWYGCVCFAALPLPPSRPALGRATSPRPGAGGAVQRSRDAPVEGPKAEALSRVLPSPRRDPILEGFVALLCFVDSRTDSNVFGVYAMLLPVHIMCEHFHYGSV